jgi:hypothetical protein
MARIASYKKDVTLTNADKVIGTDGTTGKTVNFPLSDILAYIETNATFTSVTFVFNQTTAASTWSITHNLGKFPSVSVVDSSNNVVIGEVEYNSNNQVTLTFASAFSGKAYLN